MDPTQTLTWILKVAKMIIKDWENPDSNGIDQEDAKDLAENILHLNEWINKGGMLPEQWIKKT